MTFAQLEVKSVVNCIKKVVKQGSNKKSSFLTVS